MRVLEVVALLLLLRYATAQASESTTTSPTGSAASTETQTASETQTPSTTVWISKAPTITTSSSITPIRTLTPSASPSSPASALVSPTKSPTPTKSGTPTGTRSVNTTSSASITTSNTKSPSRTTSPTRSGTPSPTKTATSTKTATKTSSVSVTPSITASASPFSYILQAHLDLLMSNDVDDLRGVLNIHGIGLRGSCITSDLSQTWTSAKLVAINTCNDTDISAEYNITTDLGPWLWYSAPLRLNISLRWSSNEVVVQHRLSSLHVAPHSIAWGDRVSLQGSYIGASRLIGLAFVGKDNRSLPCTDLAVDDMHTVSCTARYTSTILASTTAVAFHAVFQSTLDTGLQHAAILLPLANITMLEVKADNITMPALLGAGDPDNDITFDLPQLPWNTLEASVLSSPSLCELHIGNYSKYLPCDSLTSRSIRIPPAYIPDGRGMHLSAAFVLRGILSVQLGHVSYAPGGVEDVSPKVVMVQDTPGTTVAISVVCKSDIDAPLINRLSISGASCGSWTVAGRMLHCIMDASEALSSWRNDTLSLSVTIGWLDLNFPYFSLGQILLRPTVYSAVPDLISQLSPVIIFGDNFCVGAASCEVSGMEVYVGTRPCATLSAVTNTVLLCYAPSVLSSDTSYPTYQLTVRRASCGTAHNHPLLSYRNTGEVQAVSPLPTRFVPSDLSVPWPVEKPIVVAVSQGTGRRFVDGNITCSLTTTTTGVLIYPTANQELSNVLNNTYVNFGYVGIQAPINGQPVRMSVTCAVSTETDDISNIVPLAWEMAPDALFVRGCEPPVTVVASQQVMPAWSIAVEIGDGDGTANCSSQRSVTRVILPTIDCVINAAGSVAGGVGAATIIGNTAVMNATNRIATFAQMNLGGDVGATYAFDAKCFIGSIQIPPTITYIFTISGCAEGTEPKGSVCSPCAAGYYGDGGNSSCRSCPTAGVVCSNGIISLLQGYYRPPRERGRPLDASSQLYVCGDNNGCFVDFESHQYDCLPGYTGILCSVCDEELGYAKRGNGCSACFAEVVDRIIVVFLILSAFCLIGMLVAFKGGGKRSGKGIAMRVILTHIQAVGAIRMFKANGTALFQRVMSWTDVLSAAVISQGPNQCVFQPTFITVFMLTNAAPIVAAVAALFFLGIMAIVKSRQSMQSNSRTGAYQEWKNIVHSRRHIAILLLVCQLAYMPIVSMCLSVFDCTSPIDGVRYLVADSRAACEGSEYTALAVLSAIILLIMGLGFPLVLYCRLGISQVSRLQDAEFHAVWGFLYDGYRRPLSSSDPDVSVETETPGGQRFMFPRTDNLAWWESTVLLRKAGIVLLARLATDARVQLAAMLLWIGIHAFAHVYMRPYVESRYQGMETLSLTSILVTGILCVAAVGRSDGTLASLVLTILLIAINGLVLARLVWVYLLSLKTAPGDVARKVSRTVFHLLAKRSPMSALPPPLSVVDAKPFQHVNPIFKSASMRQNNPHRQAIDVERQEDPSLGAPAGLH